MQKIIPSRNAVSQINPDVKLLIKSPSIVIFMLMLAKLRMIFAMISLDRIYLSYYVREGSYAFFQLISSRMVRYTTATQLPIQLKMSLILMYIRRRNLKS